MKDPGDGSVKPISAEIISECVKRWSTQMKVAKWAYDGRNNLFAPQTLVEAGKLAADSYQEFPLEWSEPGRRHPSRYLCVFAPAAPQSLQVNKTVVKGMQ
jgi:hypothetical protein